MFRLIASAFILNFIMLGVSLANNSTSTDKIMPQPITPPAENISTTLSPPNTTTLAPNTSTTTLKPTTTTQTPKPTTTPTPVPTTTPAPAPTTPNSTTQAPTTHEPPTTALPNVTTTVSPPTTVKPDHPSDRKFDAFSFLGGFSLALGLVAIAFLSWKFYMSRQENVYHTL